MKPNKKLPLFIITGASCVGKSTMSEILFHQEDKYIVMESDLLWNDIYNTPDDEYRSYRELWLKLCSNISQIGMPVVLCGCAIPKQFEECQGRNLFTSIHYVALVCDNGVLDERMRYGRKVTDENWIKGSKEFNQWLIKNATSTIPPIKLINTSDLTPIQSADIVDKWICKYIEQELKDQSC